jgi:hypothetical protein
MCVALVLGRGDITSGNEAKKGKYTQSSLGSSFLVFVLCSIAEITMTSIVGHLRHLRDSVCR